MNNKAIVAMSGGVDSAVAAYLMKEQGFECTGVTMKLFRNEDVGLCRENSCCSLDDVADARAVAYRLDIPYFVFNFTDEFERRVIARFVQTYEAGATPNPCIDCNRYMKFDKLYQRAREIGCDTVATGHYARIDQDAETGLYTLKKAVDASKDQSYVLYSMTQEQLARTRFPLGGMHKEQARLLAAAQSFSNARKHDSQDICFVQNHDYARFIEEHTGKTYPCGDFIDPSGRVLGQHRGILHYTVGQRRGLGISAAQRLYVCDVDAERGTVTVGTERDLYARGLLADDMNWIAPDAPTAPFRAQVRTRYHEAEKPATITPLAGGQIRVELDQPQRAGAKGQAVVLYDGDCVLGGGTITSTLRD